MLVHVKRVYIPREAVLLPLEVPEHLIVELPKLPEGWNSFPYRSDVRQVGDLWVEQRASLAMFVPSAVLPAERNILINPAHADSTQIRPGEPEPHAFNPRLFNLR